MKRTTKQLVVFVRCCLLLLTCARLASISEPRRHERVRPTLWSSSFVVCLISSLIYRERSECGGSSSQRRRNARSPRSLAAPAAAAARAGTPRSLGLLGPYRSRVKLLLIISLTAAATATADTTSATAFAAAPPRRGAEQQRDHVILPMGTCERPLERRHDCRIFWHDVYGRDDPLAASFAIGLHLVVTHQGAPRCGRGPLPLPLGLAHRRQQRHDLGLVRTTTTSSHRIVLLVIFIAIVPQWWSSSQRAVAANQGLANNVDGRYGHHGLAQERHRGPGVHRSRAHRPRRSLQHLRSALVLGTYEP